MTGITHAPPELEPAESQTQREAAFSALVDRQARFLYRVAFSLLGNRQDAEDAVQETFMKLYRGTAWLAIDDEKAFLARAVWRVGLNRLGSSSAKAMRNAQDITQMDIAATADTPEQNAVSAAQRQLIKRMVQALPEDLRQPLVLSAVEGMRGNQVAAILGIPEATVRTRVMRAKAELRRRFLAAHPSLTPAEVRP